MAKVDPWQWFWPVLILLMVYGWQQQGLNTLTCKGAAAAARHEKPEVIEP